MGAYIWMMAIVLLMALLFKGNQKGSKVFIIAAALAMFVIMGFRDADSIGNDSRTSYKWQYYETDSSDWGKLSEWLAIGDNPALPRLMKAFRELTGADYRGFTVFVSAFIMFAFARLIRKYSVSPIQSICYYWGLLLYISMFSILKQAIAMSILVFAFDAIMEKKPVKFVFFVVLAALFHAPALIFLPAYWIAQIKMERTFLVMLVLMMGLTFVLRNQIVNLLEDAYFESDEIISMEGLNFFGVKVIIMAAIITAALVLRPMSNRDYLYSALIKFMAIATALQTFCYYDNVFERLADYYFQFAVIFLPLVFEKNENIQSRLSPGNDFLIKSYAPVLACAFGIWRFANYVSQDWHYIPYKFFFQ